LKDIKVTDVREKKGDAAFLIDNGKTAIMYDSGFAFTGYAVADRVRSILGERPLDYIFLTHSHYDHALGSVYAKKYYPTAKVVAGEYAAKIFAKPSARSLMRELDGKYAKKCGVPKVISKLNRLNFADVVKDMGIDSVISPKFITAHQIIQYVRAMQNTDGTEVKALYRIADNKAEVVEFLANEHTDNLNVMFRDCRLVPNTLVAALVRDGQVIIPHGNDCIMKNDGVIVVRTAGEPLYDLNEIFR